MIDLRPVLFVIGVLICAIAVAMLVPATLNWLSGRQPPEPFSIAAVLSIGLGGLFVLANRGTVGALTLRQAYVLTFLAWFAVPAIGALPLVFSELKLSYTDAFFETMSGVTTTGSTVLVGLDSMPRSILLWRALLQWLGGVGIVVMAIAILPWLRTGGMQLFHAEFLRSLGQADAAPRGGQHRAVRRLLRGLARLRHSLPDRRHEPVRCHRARHDHARHGRLLDPQFLVHGVPGRGQWVAVVFMIGGALPFVLYVRAARGDWSILRDRQAGVMVLILAVSIAMLTIWLHWHSGRPFADAIRLATFNATSVMTTTGYASDDFGVWGPFADGIFFYLMFVGGCTGSTAGAIKVFRFRVLLIVLREHIQRRFMPHAIAQRTYDGKPLSVDVVEGVMAFLALYFVAVAVGAIGLGAFGLDWLTALSGTVQAIGNVGPGLGRIIGPAGNFASLPDGAKWILAFEMLLGRLELFTVLVLLTPRFWRP